MAGDPEASAPLAWLETRGAQRDVIDGVRAIAGDWQSLWTRCARGDWMLGIAARAGVDRAALVRAAVACARTSIDALDGDLAGAATRVLEAALAWSRGEATVEGVADATRALEAATASATDPSTDAAARSAVAVGLGVVDGEPELLAGAAAFAAEATILSTLDCGVGPAMAWAHAACADAVRSAIGWEIVAARAAAG